MPLQPGTRIDKYELVSKLDQGNMGALWLAKRGPLEVAIKVVLNAEQSLLARFEAEIQTLAQLRSDHIVTIVDWGSFEGQPYLVMELLKGSNLATVLEQRGPLDRVTAVDYVVQAAAGLAQAHRKQIIHRDLKPANLFLEAGEQKIKIVDFGVAGAAPEVRQPLTGDGAYIGTPNYSAPEQFDDTKTASAAADLWALGAILYELLSGKMAFGGAYPAVITHVREQEPAPLAKLCPNLPAAVLEAVARCLKKRPRERFASAEELIQALGPLGGTRARDIWSRQQQGQLGLAATEHEPREKAAEERDTPGSLSPLVRTQPPADRPTFYPQSDLVTALLAPRGSPRRSIVFMLGAGFSMPVGKSGGVPSTNGIVDRIRARLSSDKERDGLADKLDGSKNAYQDAFDYLFGIRNQDAVNQVIRDAVLEAFDGDKQLPGDDAEQSRLCYRLELQQTKWRMPPGARHLGRLVAAGLKDSTLQHFSEHHLTTNFDPLLRISIQRSGGIAVPQAAENDLQIPPPDPAHCKIVHLHGRWNEGDTLHNHLQWDRPNLEASLARLLQKSTLVVLGYGGWEDVFMSTLRKVASRDPSQLDILWGFYEDESRIMQDRHALVRDLWARCRGRIQFYQRVDTNEFFKELAYAAIGESEAPGPVSGRSRKSWRRYAVLSGLAVGAAALVRSLVPSTNTTDNATVGGSLAQPEQGGRAGQDRRAGRGGQGEAGGMGGQGGGGGSAGSGGTSGKGAELEVRAGASGNGGASTVATGGRRNQPPTPPGSTGGSRSAGAATAGSASAGNAAAGGSGASPGEGSTSGAGTTTTPPLACTLCSACPKSGLDRVLCLESCKQACP